MYKKANGPAKGTLQQFISSPVFKFQYLTAGLHKHFSTLIHN